MRERLPALLLSSNRRVSALSPRDFWRCSDSLRFSRRDLLRRPPLQILQPNLPGCVHPKRRLVRQSSPLAGVLEPQPHGRPSRKLAPTPARLAPILPRSRFSPGDRRLRASRNRVQPSRHLRAIFAQQLADPPSPWQQCGMRQPLRPFSIIAQRIQTHEPRLRSAIDAAFITDDKKLLLRMERF